MQEIGCQAFRGCKAIENVTCNAVTPPVASADIFEDEVYQTASLSVPIASVSQYQIIYPWSNFFRNSRADSVAADDACFIVFDLSGNCLLRNASAEELRYLPSGLYIINGKKTLIK